MGLYDPEFFDPTSFAGQSVGANPFGLSPEELAREARVAQLRRQGPVTPKPKPQPVMPPPAPVAPPQQQAGPPQQALSQANPLEQQHAAALAAQERLMQPPDTTGVANYGQQRAEGGGRQLMLALAAQEAGKEFQPIQAHFLKQAAAMRDPMKMAGGIIGEEGQFVADPTTGQNLKIQQAGMRVAAIERAMQQAASAQERQRLEQMRLDAQREMRELMAGTQRAIAAQSSADRRYAADLAHQDRQAAQAGKTTPASKAAEKAAANAASGKEVLGLLDEAEKYLPEATSSIIGYGIDQAGRAFGGSTAGSRATARLRTIAGQITSKMPRMEGPQGVYDVKLYQEMAGNLADPTLPRKDKEAALATIRDLNAKYATPLQPAASGGATGGWSVTVEK